jgi:DNA-binding CsgD family transcriptional regulator
MGAGGDERDGTLLALLTGDAAVGEALAHSCRLRGLQVRVADIVSAEPLDVDVVLVDRWSGDLADAAPSRSTSLRDVRVVALVDGPHHAVDGPYDAVVALDASFEELLAAIAGTERPRRAAVKAPSTRDETLTGREREVVALLLAGLDAQSIAARLSIAENTVRTHLQNVASKLGLRGRAEIAAWALKAGAGDVEAEVRA